MLHKFLFHLCSLSLSQPLLRAACAWCPPSSCEDFPWKPLAYPPASLSLAHPLAPLPPFPSRNRLLVPPPSRYRAHLLVPPPASPSPPLLRTRSTPPSSCEDFPWKPLAYPHASLSLAHPLAPLPPFPSRKRLLV